MIKIYNCFLVIFILFETCSCGGMDLEPSLSEAIKKPLLNMAKGCLKNASATEEDLMKIKHDPPYEEKTACVIKCLLEKIKVIEDGRFSKMGFVTSITPIILTKPKKLEHMLHVADTCDKEVPSESQKMKHQCDIGNHVVLCLFKYAPELHFKV